MKLSITKFMWDQLTTPVPPVVEGNLEGKTVIVTGSNIGLGFQACKHFARMNAGKVILACRDKGRGEAALSKFKKETGYENAYLRLLDLAIFDSVRAFAQQFKEEEERLDILVENAALLPDTTIFKPTKDGWEPTVQVNNIAPSLLAVLLLPLMVDTGKKYNTTPRLVVVSSEVHYWTTIPKEVIDAPNPLRRFGTDPEYMPKVFDMSRYQDTKLLNIFFVRALSERLKDDSIIVDSLNPGYCYSSLRRKMTGIRAVLDWLMEKVLAYTTEEGSRQIVYAAIANEDKKEEMQGAYISLSKITEPSDFVIGEEGKHAQDRLWDNLIEELTKIDSSVQGIVEDLLKPTASKNST
ncbi:short-chain dehydrogenase [Pholiota molesta]|nr:short-chain dehydrogenase [Pholiota molesta]